MSGSPAFQFYASDWAHSVSSFTLEERGAYITLMTWSWEHGPVEDDVRRIAIILGVTVAQGRRLWERVSKKWERRQDGTWIQPRLERTRALQADYLAKQRANASRGGRPKTQNKPKGNPSVSEMAESENPEPIPEPNPDTIPKETSPVSDLRSPEPPRRQEQDHVSGAARARVVQDADGRYLNAGGAWKPAEQRPSNGLFSGRDHRRHGMHAWCCDRGLCVSWGLHSDFMGRLGGEDADRRLRVWYAQTIVRFEGQPVGDDLFEFWRNEFAAWVGTVTERPRTREQDTRGSRAIESFDRAGEALERHHARRRE